MNSVCILTQGGGLALNVQASFGNEIVVVSGENGAGKTTLLRIIAGLEKSLGSIQMNQSIWLDSKADFSLPVAERNIGFVWAEAVLLPWLNVEDNIKLGVLQNDEVWFQLVCERLEISKLLKRQPAKLSTGESQRTALARAIYRKPSILLLDEPFSAQAPDIRERLRLVLKKLQQQLQIPIILVSHDFEDAKVMANQHWRMREGKLINSVSDTILLATDAY